MPKVIVIIITILLTSCGSKKSWTCEEGNCENGYGKRVWTDGGIDEGIWKNGALNGQGYQFLGTKSQFAGDKYTGGFKNNKYHGNGTYYNEKEDLTYIGEWKEGRPNGKGKLTFGENSEYPNRFYDGTWKNGLRHGHGFKFWGEAGEHSNNKYRGEWQSDEMHGYGRFDWADGTYYEGSWKNDNQHGEGIITYANGEAFKGNWEHGSCDDLERKYD